MISATEDLGGERKHLNFGSVEDRLDSDLAEARTYSEQVAAVDRFFDDWNSLDTTASNPLDERLTEIWGF